MPMKNYNVKISDADEKCMQYLRKECCVNISQLIRKCIRDKYEGMKNAKECNQGNKNNNS
jgi:hypothetical protein